MCSRLYISLLWRCELVMVLPSLALLRPDMHAHIMGVISGIKDEVSCTYEKAMCMVCPCRRRL